MILTGVHHRRAGALAAAIVLAIAQDAAADGLRAGEWHTVQTPEINGMIGPPQKGTRCLTPEAVADLDTTFSPVSRTTNSTCERVEHDALRRAGPHLPDEVLRDVLRLEG